MELKLGKRKDKRRMLSGFQQGQEDLSMPNEAG